MTKVRMQGPDNSSGFSHEGVNYEADDKDIIEIPSHLVDHAKPHGFALIAEKGPKKLEPLAKSAKGGDPEPVEPPLDETEGKDGKPAVKGAKSAKGGDPEPVEPPLDETEGKDGKPAVKGAKSAKGGDQ